MVQQWLQNSSRIVCISSRVLEIAAPLVVHDCGVGHFATAAVLLGSVVIPSADTICPRKATRFWQRRHFPGFSFSPAPRSLARRPPILDRWSAKDVPTTIISSKYTRLVDHFRPLRTRSISRWKVAGALHSPTGITRNWNNPSGVVNGRLGLVVLSNFHLPVATSKIQRREVFRPDKSVQCIVHSR